MAKNTSRDVAETTATNGTMPAQTLDMASISHILKTMGSVWGALGIPSTLALPAVMLFALLIPTLLAPLSSVLNTALLCYIGYRILRKMGHLPAMFGEDDGTEEAETRRTTR